MINSIMAGISVALNTEFGDSYKTYTENIKQGLTEPCFFVSCIAPSHTLFLGMKDGNRRYRRDNQFCIQYFPADKQGARNEIHEVCEKMEMCLEWITVDNDLMMGSQMHYEIVDDVLSFFVNYNLFCTVKENEDPMEEYTIDNSVSNEE